MLLYQLDIWFWNQQCLNTARAAIWIFTVAPTIDIFIFGWSQFTSDIVTILNGKTKSNQASRISSLIAERDQKQNKVMVQRLLYSNKLNIIHRTSFEGPLFQALQGHFMTGVGWVIRFQTARGPWPGATA